MDGLEGIVLSEISQAEKDTYHMISLMCGIKQTNKQVEQKQAYRHRKHFDDVQIKEGLGGRVKKVKGWRNTHWHLQNSHGDAKHSIENIVNNIVRHTYGVRWVLELSWGITL